MNFADIQPPPPPPLHPTLSSATVKPKRPILLNLIGLGGGQNNADQKDALLSPLSNDSVAVTDFQAQTNGRAVTSPVRHSTRKTHLTSPSIYRTKRRALLKNGEGNVILVNVSKLRRRYLQDLFTTLVDAQWRWTLFIFCMSFVCSWLAFGAIWYLIAYTHGDLLPENINNIKWSPCVINMQTFVASFLFSVETQHTTGFGYRMVTEECPEAIAIFCFQSIAGLMIQAFMVGIVFAKMARPKQRCQTLMFSRNAVVSRRDGQLCFMFRIGDMRKKSHLVGATIRVRFIRPRLTPEGETLTPHITCLKASVDDYDDRVFLLWPMVVVHIIDQDSPMYGLSAAELLNERFEVSVVLEGTTESTGQTTQARTSYLASEVLWGHRFCPVVKYCKTKMVYEADLSLFHDVYKVDTPLCSAKELESYIAINDPETISHVNNNQ